MRSLTRSLTKLQSLLVMPSSPNESREPTRKTLTFDNGMEFAECARIDQSLQSTTYFADPFASWQRGSNKNFDGLLRQCIPKK